MNDLTIEDRTTGAHVELPSIGAGTMRTSATYAALFIALEGGREERMAVLNSVLEVLKIAPAELEHYREEPDVCNEVEHQAWEREGESIRASHFGA